MFLLLLFYTCTTGQTEQIGPNTQVTVQPSDPTNQRPLVGPCRGQRPTSSCCALSGPTPNVILLALVGANAQRHLVGPCRGQRQTLCWTRRGLADHIHLRLTTRCSHPFLPAIGTQESKKNWQKGNLRAPAGRDPIMPQTPAAHSHSPSQSSNPLLSPMTPIALHSQSRKLPKQSKQTNPTLPILYSFHCARAPLE